MTFIQIIEVTTTHQDEIEFSMDERVATTEGKRRAQRSTVTAHRDQPGVWRSVEFPSYEEAMANCNLPETRRVRRTAG